MIVFVVAAFVVVVGVFVIVGHKNLTLKFGQNCFSFGVVVDPETKL